MTVLRVDFNDIDENGRVAALRRLARPSSGLALGETVYLRDSEGNLCLGEIALTEESLVYVQPDWTTWVTASDKHLVPQGWWAVVAGELRGASQGSVGVRVHQVLTERNTGDAPVSTVLPRVRQRA